MSLADNVVGVNPVKSLSVSETVILQVIALPCGTFAPSVFTVALTKVMLALLVVQFEPPSNEYSILA